MEIIKAGYNNSFQQRIKIASPTAKFIGGSAMAATGVASIFTGADAVHLIPTGICQQICENIENEHEVWTNDGLIIVNNEAAAIKAASAMLAAPTVGSCITPLGSFIAADAYKKINDLNTEIPT